MSTNGLPDIYTLSPQTCGPWALGVYIRQTTSAYGITTMVQLISNFMLASTKLWVSAFFSYTLLKLVCLISQLTCSSLYLIVTGLLACAQAITRVACIANMWRVLITHYVFTGVHHVHYVSSRNSPVNIMIGKHIRKGRGLILLVNGSAKINHLSTNYTEFYFC